MVRGQHDCSGKGSSFQKIELLFPEEGRRFLLEQTASILHKIVLYQGLLKPEIMTVKFFYTINLIFNFIDGLNISFANTLFYYKRNLRSLKGINTIYNKLPNKYANKL